MRLGRSGGSRWHRGAVRAGGMPPKAGPPSVSDPGNTSPDSARSESTVSETSVGGWRLVRGPEAQEKD